MTIHNSTSQTRPEWMTDEWLKSNRYFFARQIPSGPYQGSWMALTQMLFSVRLVAGMDETGWSCCYDYKNFGDALIDIVTWNGEGDPEGDWLKYRGPGGERTKSD